MLPEEQAELDRLSDSFFAGMRKVAEYNFEGVDGETRKMKKSENDNENDNKNDFGEKKKNIAKKKKSSYNEYNTMGMIWAYNASTEIGDTKVMYNPYKKTYILASCTKDDIGFIELYSGSMEEMEEMEKYGSEHRTERNNRYSGGFRLGNRLDIGNDDFSENGGDEEGNVRFSSGAETRKQIVGGTNDNGQTVADPENRKAENKETSNKIAAEDDLRYLEAVKNGDMATAQAMVEQVAREKGYDKGFYNIIVTQYEPDSLKNYLKDCEIIYDKKTMNGKYQVGSGRVVASAHDMPFIANTIVPKNSDLSTEHKKKIKAFPAVTKINGLKKTEKPICMTLFRLQIKI